MFHASHLNPATQTWTPAVHLTSAQECALYCWLGDVRGAVRIRITDAQDRLVVQVVDHVLRCLQADGTWQATRLGGEGTYMEPVCPCQRTPEMSPCCLWQGNQEACACAEDGLQSLPWITSRGWLPS